MASSRVSLQKKLQELVDNLKNKKQTSCKVMSPFQPPHLIWMCGDTMILPFVTMSEDGYVRICFRLKTWKVV